MAFIQCVFISSLLSVSLTVSGLFSCMWSILITSHGPADPSLLSLPRFLVTLGVFFFVSVGAFKQLSAFLVPRGTETPSDRRGGNFRNTLEVVYHTCEGWSRKCRLEENKKINKKRPGVHSFNAFILFNDSGSGSSIVNLNVNVNKMTDNSIKVNL